MAPRLVLSSHISTATTLAGGARPRWSRWCSGVVSLSLLANSLVPAPLWAAGPFSKPAGNPNGKASSASAPSAGSNWKSSDTSSAPKTPSQLQDEPTDNEAKVRLNYFGATWDQVLKDVAEGTGTTLIADRVPTGRFTRRDRTEYTRVEALRIINREIEPHGFRVVEKAGHLIVLDLPSQRPRYQPKVVRSAPEVSETEVASGAAQRVTSPKPVRQSHKVLPVSAEVDAELEDEAGVTAAYLEEEPVEQPPSPKRAEVPSRDNAPHRLTTEPVIVAVFRARNQRATDLAKQVFRAFRDRAELVDAGREGLPAFRVHERKQGDQPAPVQFSLAIDEDKEELLIDARSREADALLRLLRRLDTPTAAAGDLQIVATSKAACLAAAMLPEAIAEIQQVKQEQEAEAGEADPAAMPPQAAPDAPAEKTPLSEVLGNLKGQVNVEAVEDLGVLILQGGERDLEQVMRVIRELERLSEATAPQVHLLYLKHVNSEALAELMTTVYEQLTKFPGKATQPRQNIAILPVSKPNAILIVAPKNDLEGILELAEELDAPVDPEAEVEVVPLETAIASQVESLLADFYEERKGLGPRIVVRADARSNSIIVQAKPSDLDEVITLIRKIDRDETAAASQLKIYVLKNAVATELSAVLNAAIQSVLAPPSNQASQGGQQGGFPGAGGSNQIAEEFRDVKSSVLQFLAVDAEGQRKLQSGVLADIRITADPRLNSLLVTAPDASQSLIGELIKNLDRPTGQVAEIKVFTLANADATQMVQQLQQLFTPGAQQGGQGGAGQRQNAAIGIQVAGAEDASSGLIPLRFSVDTRTNSVIAIGAADAIGVVEAIMFRLDESDLRARKNSVYRLKNSPAQTVADAVTQFLGSQSELRQQDPNLFSTVEQLEQEVIVVAEPVSNSLLISATPRYFDEIQQLVERLDEAPKQVIIQALLVEVDLQNTDELGVELGFQDSVLFNRSILDAPVTIAETVTSPNGVQTTSQRVISQSGQPGFLFGNPQTPLGNNLGTGGTNKVGSQGLSNFSVGRVNGDLGYGGLVLSASSESVSMLLRALSANRQVRILSRPQIRTLDNQQAQILQGQVVPVVQGVTQAANGIANPQVRQDEAGIILTVTPRISPDGNIVMQLVAEKSQYQLNTGVPIFTDANSGNVIRSPIKDISTARATVMVPNGQTIVLGGLITSSVDTAERKVPWLGDVPILGWAFRYDFQQTRRTELLVFLTPRIITDDAESEHISDVEIARMHFIESEAEEIHGPLRGVPAEEYCPPEGTVLPPGSYLHGVPAFDLTEPVPPPAPTSVQGGTSPVPQSGEELRPVVPSAVPNSLPETAEPVPMEGFSPIDETDAVPVPQGSVPSDTPRSNSDGMARVQLRPRPSKIQQVSGSFEEDESASRQGSGTAAGRVSLTAPKNGMNGRAGTSVTAGASRPAGSPPASGSGSATGMPRKVPLGRPVYSGAASSTTKATNVAAPR
jgi:general secretion pathway protein D